MKLLLLGLLGITLVVGQSIQKTYPVSKDGIDFSVQSSIAPDGKELVWTSSITAKSPISVRLVCWGLKKPGKKTYLFSGCTGLMKPQGGPLTRTAPRTAGLDKLLCDVLSVKRATPIDRVEKIFVQLEGSNALLAGEQVMASIATETGGRFQVVDEERKADSIMRGMAEVRDTGQVYSSQSDSSTGGARGAMVVPGLAMSGGRTTTTAATQGQQETLTRQVLVLRLVRDGQTIWAWDGGQNCPDAPAKCAALDLLNASAR